MLEAEPGFCVVGEADDGAKALQLARELKPDIVLLDLAMRSYSGMAALRDLASQPESVRVIVLAAEIDSTQMVEALELGARALVLKGYATEELIESIHNVKAGQYWIGQESVAILVQALRDLRSSTTGSTEHKGLGLTTRELEIIEMIAKAHSNREIAEKFSIGEETVKRHVEHILTSLVFPTAWNWCCLLFTIICLATARLWPNPPGWELSPIFGTNYCA